MFPGEGKIGEERVRKLKIYSMENSLNVFDICLKTNLFALITLIKNLIQNFSFFGRGRKRREEKGEGRKEGKG